MWNNIPGTWIFVTIKKMYGAFYVHLLIEWLIFEALNMSSIYHKYSIDMIFINGEMHVFSNFEKFRAIRAGKSVDSFVEPVYMKDIYSLKSKIWNHINKNTKTSTSTNSFKYALRKRSRKTEFFYCWYNYHHFLFNFLIYYKFSLISPWLVDGDSMEIRFRKLFEVIPADLNPRLWQYLLREDILCFYKHVFMSWYYL